MREGSDTTSDPVLTAARGPVGRSVATNVVAQQAAVAQIGQSALAADSLDQLLSEACVLVSRVLDTELVSVLELLPGALSLKLVAGLGWRRGLVGELVVGANSESQAGYTLTTGGPVIVADLATEDRFTVTSSLVEHGAVSGMSVRIGGPDKPFGAMSVFTARRGHFSREDAHFLQSVANVLAAAVGRMRIEAELRASRDQLAAIVSTTDEGVTVTGGGKLLFANDTAAHLTGFENAEEFLAAGPGVVARYDLYDEDGQPMSVDALPGRRAMMGEDKPQAVVGFRIHATGEMRWSMVRGTAVRDANGEISHVINTFREVTDERWARESRTFIADAVAVLSSTLDANEAARRLATLSVPRLADYCTVHLLSEDGDIVNVALTHSDPARLDIALRLQQIRPVMRDAPTGVARVIREGTPEIQQVTPEILDAAAETLTGEELDLVKRLEMSWYLAVPLMGRHGAIGALSLVMADSNRILGDRDLALAEELGVRAGIALENARLYQTSDDRRAQLDAVLGALDEAVLVFNGDGDLRLANEAAERMLGAPVPMDISALRARFSLDDGNIDGGGAGGGSVLGSGQFDAEPAASEPLEVRLDSGDRWLEMRRYRAARSAADTSEMRSPTVVVLRDVTAARAARAARDAFMGVLSHELRTPITTIYGGSELLERELDPERRKEVMSDIRAESERLARLVEDLLVMTRIERDMVESGDEPILIQRLLPPIVNSFLARWPEAKVRVKLDERLPAVRGDPTYVEQIVRNLLTNALRYGRGTELGVELVSEEADGVVVVRVLDSGPGFTEGEASQLFDLFYRTQSGRSVPGGAGIGLFVCRHLVEAMGGRIWARPRPEGGAEFGFSVPIMETDLAG